MNTRYRRSHQAAKLNSELLSRGLVCLPLDFVQTLPTRCDVPNCGGGLADHLVRTALTPDRQIGVPGPEPGWSGGEHIARNVKDRFEGKLFAVYGVIDHDLLLSGRKTLRTDPQLRQGLQILFVGTSGRELPSSDA